LRARWVNDISATEAYLALAGTVFGGAGLKAIESVLGRAKRRDDTATMLRAELREELHTLREEMKELKSEADRREAEADRWRSRYFALLAAVAVNDEEYLNKVLKTPITE
jgi:predicted nuclease with TOPRIM domain